MYKIPMKKFTPLQRQAIIITGLLGGGFGIGSLTIIATKSFAVSTMEDICSEQAREARANQQLNTIGIAGYDETTGECTYRTNFGNGLIWVQRWDPQ